MISAAVVQIVARYRGDHDMFQVHPAHRFGHALRLVFFRAKGFAVVTGQNPQARATVARDHESGRALTPAFPSVRALRALANGVQSQIGNQRFG